MKVVEYIDTDEWQEKYNIGDMFVDSFSSEDTDEDVVCYIYRIEYQPDSKVTYYWARYLNKDLRDNYWTEDELDGWIENGIKHYPVKK